MTFRVGQKVVCVENQFEDPYPGDIVPVRGEVYTIRALEPGCENPSETYVLLEEIVNPPNYFVQGGYGELSWDAEAFRPVKTTSIAIFRAMLVSPPKVVVDA